MNVNDIMENHLVEFNNRKGDLERGETSERIETEYHCINDPDIWLPPEVGDEEDDVDEVINENLKTLLKNIVKSTEKYGYNWVDLITSLLWNVSPFSKGEVMDPDCYVKVKCLPTGSPSQSEVFDGLVFKASVLEEMPRRLDSEIREKATRFESPKLILIKGAINDFEGLLSVKEIDDERNRLRLFIGMIEKCNPDVMIVEKNVSRDIQIYTFERKMALVYDMNISRLERIARCTGSSILSYGDQFSDENLGKCDSFYLEEHGVSEGGEKPKTLMFLKGLPNRMGCTILLKGSQSDELKKIKNVVQFAYHQILEDSFLLHQRVIFSTISSIYFLPKSPP